MIIQIAGPSGSGKSTLVSQLMNCYDKQEAQLMDGRERPVGYTCSKKGIDNLYVLGSYKNGVGGCDTLTTIDDKLLDHVYEVILAAQGYNTNVIYESCILERDVRKLISVAKKFPLMVVTLNTRIESCLSRRPNTKYTTDTFIRSRQRHRRLKLAKITTHLLSYKKAFNLCKEVLELDKK
jgi:ABC-type dipeptide/oligopeptide/nickel transport system ATPase component